MEEIKNIQNTNNNIQTFKCEECNKVFTSKLGLATHIGMKHKVRPQENQGGLGLLDFIVWGGILLLIGYTIYKNFQTPKEAEEPPRRPIYRYYGGMRV